MKPSHFRAISLSLSILEMLLSILEMFIPLQMFILYSVTRVNSAPEA